MSLSIVVPFRGGCPHRERAYLYVRARLAVSFPTAEIIDADDGGKVFSRERSLNLGASRAKGDMLVFHEADCIVAPRQILAAIDLAALDPGRLVLPYSTVYLLSPEATDLVISGPSGADLPGVSVAVGMLGGIGVISRATFERVGGFDSSLEGWGRGDVSFVEACDRHAAPTMRTMGELLHLWHPPSPSKASFLAAQAAA